MTLTKAKTDSGIKADVLAELKWDTKVDETEVGVQVKKGVVTLSGTVGSYAKRFAAQEAAHRVRGVLDVANDMEVKFVGSEGRTDAEIAQAVRSALQRHVMVPEQKIQTTVSRGVVTLGGTVDHWYQREEAERAVHNLTGVRSVINNLALSATPAVSPDAIRRSIEGALERRAERTAGRISTIVSGSKVKLQGAVRSWSEKEAILGAARATAGVQEVEDRLHIELD